MKSKMVAPIAPLQIRETLISRLVKSQVPMDSSEAFIRGLKKPLILRNSKRN